MLDQIYIPGILSHKDKTRTQALRYCLREVEPDDRSLVPVSKDLDSSEQELACAKACLFLIARVDLLEVDS